MDRRFDHTFEEYIEEKIRLIEEDFYIPLTEDERVYLQTSKTEAEVDRRARKIFMNRL